jgi:hypothetical protein
VSTINFNNKSLIFPQIVSEKGRHTKRHLVNTFVNNELVEHDIRLIETVTNKSEMVKVTAFDARCRQTMLKLATPGPKGMHLIANERIAELRALVDELKKEATDLNYALTVCHVSVDCLVVPVDLTLDHHTADRMRAHVQGMLADLSLCIVAPNMAETPTQRYSKARTQYYACQHLVSWVFGINADLVRAAIDEAGERCIDVKSVPPSSLPSVEAAIALFSPVDVENVPQFAELPF